MSEQSIQGKTVAFLVASEGIEQVELTEPWKAVQEAGGTPRLLRWLVALAPSSSHRAARSSFRIPNKATLRACSPSVAI